MTEHIILFVIALFSNTLSALAGGGAGLVQLPALIFMGLPFTTALATHKIATVALGVGASLKHSQSSRIRLNLSLPLLIAGLPGVLIGAKTVLLIPETIAKTVLGILTVLLGLYSIYNKHLGLEATHHKNNFMHILGGAAGLCVIGFLNGAFSSGTGLFVTLWLVIWYGCDYKQATAHTMIFVGLFWNGIGATAFALLAQVQWDWLPVLLVASLLGGYLGATLSIKKGNVLVKRIFEFVTLLVGVSLILHATL